MISCFTGEASARMEPRTSDASQRGELREKDSEDLQTVPEENMAPDGAELVLAPMDES